MGSMFILIITVVCTRVITGLICFMFIERMLTCRYYSDFMTSLIICSVIRVIWGLLFH